MFHKESIFIYRFAVQDGISPKRLQPQKSILFKGSFLGLRLNLRNAVLHEISLALAGLAMKQFDVFCSFNLYQAD